MAEMTERQKTAHLLNRFGLGASESEVREFGRGGHKAAIEKLLDYKSVPERWEDIDPVVFQNSNGNTNMVVTKGVYAVRLLASQRPLEEKLTLFWHDHFGVGAQKVSIPATMTRHINLLRSGATGKFRTLLGRVSKDPAMLYFLDNNENVKGSPNENFAREVMELFTLGVDNGYTEEDISEAARAFTGWTFGFRGAQRVREFQRPNPQSRFVVIPGEHDNGMKTVLGKSGNLGGDDILDILCKDKQTARYLALKMWEYFVYPEPSPTLLERLTEKFYASDLDISVLVRAIMESKEFYSEKAKTGVVKSPVDFCIGTMRQLGQGEAAYRTALNAEEKTGGRAARFGTSTSVVMRSMGMDLLDPPDVSGWTGGQAWISSATMIERMKWSKRLFGQRQGNRNQARRQNQQVFQRLGRPETAAELVDSLIEVFDAGKLEEKKEILVKAAAAEAPNGVTADNCAKAADAAAALIFGSPEFQFS
jgi:uncharacterized protein (DUF1800 family)